MQAQKTSTKDKSEVQIVLQTLRPEDFEDLKTLILLLSKGVHIDFLPKLKPKKRQSHVPLGTSPNRPDTDTLTSTHTVQCQSSS